MSIQDLQKTHTRQYENLKSQQSREISRLQDTHQNLKEDIKKVQADEIVEIQKVQDRKVHQEQEKTEKLLAQMKNQLNTTQEMTDKEIKDLKSNNEKIKATEQRKLETNRTLLNETNSLALEELHERYGQQTRKVNYEGQEQVKDLKNQRQRDLSETSDYYQNKINQEAERLTEQYNAKRQNFEKLAIDQDRQFKEERFQKNINQQKEIDKLATGHRGQLEKRDELLRKGLHEQDQVFEKKYANNLEQNNAELSVLENKKNAAIQKMKADLKAELKTTADKSKDSFYVPTELTPSLKKYDKYVEVQIPIPEHAQNDVFMTINNKTIIVNFNRRFEDQRSSDGITSKVNRVESLVSKIDSGEHLNSKSVKKSYENGVMTYQIQKA